MNPNLQRLKNRLAKIERILAMYAKGEKLEVIAATLGCTASNICQQVEHYGTLTRTPRPVRVAAPESPLAAGVETGGGSNRRI